MHWDPGRGPDRARNHGRLREARSCLLAAHQRPRAIIGKAELIGVIDEAGSLQQHPLEGDDAKGEPSPW